MKLYSIASLLLLAPLVFAQRPQLAKLVYKAGLMITDTSDSLLIFRRNDSFLSVSLFSYKFPNAGLMVLPYATAPLNETPFVVEWVVGPDADAVDETDQFCRSDSELSSLIAKCSGLARLRAPTADETSQIEALQTEAEETGQTVRLLHEDGKRLTSKSIGINHIIIDSSEKRLLSVEALRKPYFWMNLRLKHWSDKRFVVEAPVLKSNCRHAPVEAMKVIDCEGQVRITKLSDANKTEGAEPESPANPSTPASAENPNAPAIPSLDDLAAEELRILLKDLMSRL